MTILIDTRFHFPGIAALLIALVGLSGCREGKVADYSLETHTSKSYPLCTFAIYRDLSGYDQTSILYYFHGSEGDENAWGLANRKITGIWREKGFKPPIVVAVTFGAFWSIYPEGLSRTSVRMEAFVGDLMPEIENACGGTATRRSLYGFSMGGRNAAQLFFRYPELFEKAAIVSPYLFPISIFASESEINALVETVNAHRTGLRDWIKIVVLKKDDLRLSIRSRFDKLKAEFPDPETWDKADILKNVKKVPEGMSRAVYLSCGTQDGNGFFPGAERLARIAGESGYDVEFDPLKGGHMTMNDPRIAAFLIQ